MEHDNFRDFCRTMYEECKSERRKYNEDQIDFDDYVMQNNKLLVKEYARQNSK